MGVTGGVGARVGGAVGAAVGARIGVGVAAGVGDGEGDGEAAGCPVGVAAEAGDADGVAAGDGLAVTEVGSGPVAVGGTDAMLGEARAAVVGLEVGGGKVAGALPGAHAAMAMRTSMAMLRDTTLPPPAASYRGTFPFRYCASIAQFLGALRLRPVGAHLRHLGPQALEKTEYDYGTLGDAKWVAKSVELSRRREDLSWSHHREVVACQQPGTS